MANQIIRIIKNSGQWDSAEQADAEIRGKAGSDIITFYENSKANGNLEVFNIDLENVSTLKYTRAWSDAGWAAMSSRQTEFNELKSQLESEGYIVNLDQPDYV